MCVGGGGCTAEEITDRSSLSSYVLMLVTKHENDK